jgi:hypothetical protein
LRLETTCSTFFQVASSRVAVVCGGPGDVDRSAHASSSSGTIGSAHIEHIMKPDGFGSAAKATATM